MAIAVAWILNIAGVFPFNNRGTNQIGSTATPSPNAQNTGSQSLNANNPASRQSAQNFGTGQSNSTTTSSTDPTLPAPPNNGTANYGTESTTSNQTPAVRAGW